MVVAHGYVSVYKFLWKNLKFIILKEISTSTLDNNINKNNNKIMRVGLPTIYQFPLTLIVIVAAAPVCAVNAILQTFIHEDPEAIKREQTHRQVGLEYGERNETHDDHGHFFHPWRREHRSKSINKAKAVESAPAVAVPVPMTLGATGGVVVGDAVEPQVVDLASNKHSLSTLG